MASRVAVLKTSPSTVVEDYARLMRMVDYTRYLPRENDTVLKINISWHYYYPACSTTPWQLEGVIRTMLEDGYRRESLLAAQNRTVVVNPEVGAIRNNLQPVVDRYGVRTVWLYKPEVEWVVYEPQHPMLVLDKIFPAGITIPESFIGRNALHLPTMKCVHPDTDITLADGSRRKIGELVESELRRGAVALIDADGEVCLAAGYRLWSLYPQGRLAPQPTRFLWRTPVKGQKIWRICTKTGREVKVSSEHPFLTPKGWKRAAELKPGCRIAIPRVLLYQGVSQPLPQVTAPDELSVLLERIPFRKGRKFTAEEQRAMVAEYLTGDSMQTIAQRRGLRWQSVQSVLLRYRIPTRRHGRPARVPERTSPEFWRWMGYFFAEGWVQPMGTTCRFWWTNGAPAVAQDFCQLTRQLFNITVTPRPHSHDYYFDSVQMQSLFEQLGLPLPLTARNKRVPSVLFQCPPEEIAQFLQGYLEGDGSVGKDGLHVTTASPTLAVDVQDLLLRLGVVAFRREVKIGAYERKQKRRYFQVSVYGGELVRLARWLHFLSSSKQQALEALVRQRQKGKCPSNGDTIPLDPEQVQRARQGLKLTQQARGKLSSVNNLGNRYGFPSLSVAPCFLPVFAKQDTEGRCTNEIRARQALASDDIVWDHVTKVEAIEPDVSYLYDFTMAHVPNFVGNGLVLHNTHVFTQTTGAIKNAFGGLLQENRHWCHAHIHEALVDLLTIQREIHSGLFAVMDGTIAGNGPGPRAMQPVVTNYLLASDDQVAIDAIAAKIMGFDPLQIKYLRLAHEAGLGCADPREIEIVGEDLSAVNLGFTVGDTFASRGQKLIYHGALKRLEHFLLRTPIVPWAYFASRLYHDFFWFNLYGRARRRRILRTEWGDLFHSYTTLARQQREERRRTGRITPLEVPVKSDEGKLLE